jgi:arabinose-5-phosphate isomerase
MIGTRVLEAVEILRRHKISELPVVDTEGRPVGMLDITDLIGLLPAEGREDNRWEVRSA